MDGNKRPIIKSEQERDIFEWESAEPGSSRVLKWIHFTADDEAFVGVSNEPDGDLTLDQYSAGVKRLNDHDVFPPATAVTHLTVAPDAQSVDAVFIKRGSTYKW